MNIPRLVIAGTQSGVGKTTLTLGLTALLRRRGLKVQTFKVGPDYLDPTYLKIASGRTCYNLDGWMMGREYVESLFARAAANADIAIVEGVMGLFDGASATSAEGSTAEIARWLDAPVLLVLNAHGMARSVAATVHGYTTFDPQLRVAGVLANSCGSAKHGDLLAESLQAASLAPLLGAIPRGALPELPSRHLGLVTADSTNLTSGLLDQLADALEKTLSVEAILNAARQASELSINQPPVPVAAVTKCRLGIAYDDAFHFYYPDNLEALTNAGCELVPFSPINDKALPSSLNGIYFGGGYPEEHAAALAANKPMLDEVRQFAARDGWIYGECGGLMYLSEAIETLNVVRYPLVGLLPARTRMCSRRQSLGYVEVSLAEDCIWGRRGDKARGHEFHYSELVTDPTCGGTWRPVYDASVRRAGTVRPEGYRRGNILLSYMHLHFASRPGAVQQFVASLKQ